MRLTNGRKWNDICKVPQTKQKQRKTVFLEFKNPVGISSKKEDETKFSEKQWLIDYITYISALENIKKKFFRQKKNYSRGKHNNVGRHEEHRMVKSRSNFQKLKLPENASQRKTAIAVQTSDCCHLGKKLKRDMS